MKLMKRANIYQASNYNCTFDPTTKKAVSYKWWTFVAEIEGKIVFNNFRYSVSTSKHQRKVRSLLAELGIKIDLELPLPKGIMPLDSLEELILTAEEHLCDVVGNEELKRQERNEKAALRRKSKKLESYLENDCAFRDYEIEPISRFGKINSVAVHQQVDMKDMERDVQNALYNFGRDGFGSIVFYV
jgi:hypothetical protein